eukprot:GDKI01015207.1.p1 GENE.GDKI01015207.1~~GDKI01015207.1.p1  ORF type:complete len:635 (+),score=204.10 GDKI01015207.1:121-2025(+)
MPAGHNLDMEDFEPTNAMWCYQCEQTSGGTGCVKQGVCGKTPEVAALQDMLVHKLKELAFYAHKLRTSEKNAEDAAANEFTLDGLFSTLTNVNFDAERFVTFLRDAEEHIERLKKCYESELGTGAPTLIEESAKHYPIVGGETYMKHLKDGKIESLAEMGVHVGVQQKKKDVDNDALVGLQEMLVYGLKGTAAYADHARLLGQMDNTVYAFLHEALYFLMTDKCLDVGACVDMNLKCGASNFHVMELLSKGHEQFGTPTPHMVNCKPKPGKCILVSGHDMYYLHELLKQTEGKGINVYTHGEMMPAHMYPTLRAYTHLVGHYGTAWNNQQRQFPKFPGAILVTTNCIMPLDQHSSYENRIFSISVVGADRVAHVNGTDFSAVIKAAQEAEGFKEGEEQFAYKLPGVRVLPDSLQVGYSYQHILANAGAIIDLIKAGKINRFYLIGGCDGSEGERSFYTDLAQQISNKSVILTLGCGKFRIMHLAKQLGNVEGTEIPRILDMGQCNDAFGAIMVAVALSKAFNCTVNELPLSIVLSWFEQKAVAVLLTLMHLGVKPLHIGPKLPGFVHPSLIPVLHEKFGITPLATPEEVAKDVTPDQWATFRHLVELSHPVPPKEEKKEEGLFSRIKIFAGNFM